MVRITLIVGSFLLMGATYHLTFYKLTAKTANEIALSRCIDDCNGQYAFMNQEVSDEVATQTAGYTTKPLKPGTQLMCQCAKKVDYDALDLITATKTKVKLTTRSKSK